MENSNLLLRISKQLKNIIDRLDAITNKIYKTEEFHLSEKSVGKIDGTRNIGIQNNFNALFSIKPITLSSKNNKIRVFKHSYSDWLDILEHFVLSFSLFGVIFYVFIFPGNLVNIFKIFTDWEQHLGGILSFSFMSFFAIVIFTLIDKYRKKMYLEVGNYTITIGQLDKKKSYIENKYLRTLEFKDIRSIYKRKSLLGYTFYIYKVCEINPFLCFNTESIHFANTIDELITYKIKEQIRLDELELLKKNSL